MQDHTKWMQLALQEAQKALIKKEVPVGAIVVHEDRVIGRGYNLMETLQDPTAHAEMLSITAAANTLASWRLADSILYITLEPCIMCTGAALLSRIPLIVYGAADTRYGACGGALNLTDGQKMDLQTQVVGGVLETECSSLLKEFFRKIRKKQDKGDIE